MEIKDYQNSDYVEIADLFHGSIHAVDPSIYSMAQLEAWAPTPPDYNHWEKRLIIKKPFVAIDGGNIVGFIELENDGHIDCLYVHKNHQGKGIASKLLQHLREVADEQGLKTLYVEASKIAMPLFKKHGFELKSENSVNVRGQSLTNYTMSLAQQPS